MNTQSLFCLSGSGYLHEVIQKEDHVIARIKALVSFDTSSISDEIWIDCIVNDTHQQARLIGLLRAGLPENITLLEFKIRYKGYADAFPLQWENELHHIVHLSGELISVGKVYVNGRHAVTIDDELLAVA